MDRECTGADNRSNPEFVPVDLGNHLSAAEPERFDASTVDPSHIIHLIRQLLPSGIRADSLRFEQPPVGSGVECLLPESNAAEGLSPGKNWVVTEALKVEELVSIYKNGVIPAGQAVATKPDKKIEGNLSATGAGLESASSEPSTVAIKCKERSSTIHVIEENCKYFDGNGNHTEENGSRSEEKGDLRRKRVCEVGKEVEQNGDSPEYAQDHHWKSPERYSEANLISARLSDDKNKLGDKIVVVAEGEGIKYRLENDVDQKTGGGEDDAREEAGCVLWDLAATESHAEFLVEHHILDVLLAFLHVPQSDRMTEICLGVFGNLACHSGPVRAMVETQGLIETLVQQLFVDNTPILTETCRLLSAGLHSEATATWVESIKPDHVLERIMWMAANTLNSQLLEKCTELILVMVDSRRDAASVLLPSLLRLGLPGLLTDLIACELDAISKETSSVGDVVLDIVLQIAEAISIPDDSASELAASDKLFSLSCQVIRLSARDEIGPSGITATVLIANLLTEEAGLIQQVLYDAIFLGRLLALMPCAGDDPGARNALWSILGRVCNWLVSMKLEDPPYCTSGVIAVLADGCSLLLDDLDLHEEDDVEEDEDRELAGHDAADSTSRGLRAKETTVSNMMRIMEQWTTVHGGSSTQDILLLRSIRNASSRLKNHIASNEILRGTGSKG